MESDSSSLMKSDSLKMDIKVEIKEEPHGTLTEIKSECEEFETVFITSSFVTECADREMCNQKKIKDEPCWSESTSNELQEMEVPYAADVDLKNEIQDAPTSVKDGVPTALQRSIYEAAISEGRDTPNSCTVASWETKSCVKRTSNGQHCENTNDEGVIIKSYKCDICEKCFKKKSNLRSHILIHEGKKPYSCEICEKSFQQSSNLKQHYMLHKGIRRHRCVTCGRRFMQAELFNQHKMTHIDERPHVCEICGKHFMQAGCLNRHSIIHKDKRPYKCEICSKTFKHNAYLKIHYVIHESKRPYKCKICKKGFKRSSCLKKHIMIHEGIKPHKCEICDRRFYTPWDLKRHKRVHEKPHKCDVCGKSYIHLSELRKHHLMTHSGNGHKFIG